MCQSTNLLDGANLRTWAKLVIVSDRYSYSAPPTHPANLILVRFFLDIFTKITCSAAHRNLKLQRNYVTYPDLCVCLILRTKTSSSYQSTNCDKINQLRAEKSRHKWRPLVGQIGWENTTAFLETISLEGINLRSYHYDS